MSAFAKLASLVALAAIATPALAHIEMINPVPLRSPHNTGSTGPTDYSYTDPLHGDGSNYPCKGYAADAATVPVVATLNAGSSFSVGLAGSAVHGGGSCQFSISYDAGKTWGVLHQLIGNCPTENASYSFDVPAGLPSAKNVLFAWTWFNKIGNREMYMNCAAVDVMGSSGSLELPQMFEANHFGAGVCSTPETMDVDFANPVLTGCSPDKLVTPDKKVTVGSGAAAPAPPASAPASTPSAPASTPAAPASTSASPAPSGGTTPPASGGAVAWAADKVFIGGATACYNGKTYTAKWWTQGEEPGKGDVWGAAGAAC